MCRRCYTVPIRTSVDWSRAAHTFPCSSITHETQNIVDSESKHCKFRDNNNNIYNNNKKHVYRKKETPTAGNDERQDGGDICHCRRMLPGPCSIDFLSNHKDGL